MKMRLGGAVRCLGILLLAGCSSDSGTATLKFALSTASTRVENRADASGFQMKLIAAYLAEDIDATTGSNVGNTAMIYLNPTCADDISHCDVTAGTAEDGTPFTKIVTDFFDFTSATAANTALNAQGLAIAAGTYKYARLEFCKYADGSDPNIKWSYSAGSVSNASFKQNSCTVNSAVFSPTVTVAAGSSVEITLSYSLSGTVTAGSGGSNCSGGFCFSLPQFTPSAAVLP